MRRYNLAKLTPKNVIKGGCYMAGKPSLMFSIFFLCVAVIACTPQATSSPIPEQNSIETVVAATVQAAITATQRAILTAQPTKTLAPTSLPTQPQPTLLPTTQITPTFQLPPHIELQVAYIKNSDVYLWTDGQAAVRLTDLHDAVSVRISDDGELIAFKRQSPDDVTLQELWVVNTSGVPDPHILVSATELADLVPPDAGSSILGYGVLNFSWRPHTHDLVYNTLILHEGIGSGLNHDLRLVSADTLEKTVLFDTGEGGLFYYSPDGNQIALSNPGSISLVDADGSNLRADVLTFPHVITYSEYEYHPHLIWAADSNSLRVAIPPHDPLAEPLQATGLWFIPTDGSPGTLLGEIQAIPYASPNAAFAPDLDHVIFATPTGNRTSNQRELRIADGDGTNEITYDQGESLEFISWSPDSWHFIYQIHQGDKKGVYMGSLNTQPKLIVFDPNVVQNIKWLGSSRLVFPFQDGNQWLLLIQNPSDGVLTRIDEIPDNNPDFDVLP
jgi:hypothetical protein